MDSPQDQLLVDNFNRVLLHAGWGDPIGGLWFVGIEEGSSWADDPRSVAKWFDEDAKDRIRHLGGMTYEHGLGVVGLPPSRGSKVQRWVQTIVDGVRETDTRALQSTSPPLWAPGSRIFNTNLYPLARPAVSMQPRYFQTHFGVADAEAYKQIVHSTRFPALASFRASAAPRAIVCFGKGFWDQFEKLLNLPPTDRKLGDDGKWGFHEGERVVLAPFFGYWHMNRDRATAIARKLREWNVHDVLPA